MSVHSDTLGGTVAGSRRNIAIVGPYASGKTTLLESLLFVSGALSRKGSTREKNSLGDSAPEAREHGMGVEVNVAHSQWAGMDWTWLDCPGSVELAAETLNALVGVDAAIVCCEPLVDRALILSPLLQFLDTWKIPHVLFINKMDRASSGMGEILAALQPVSSRPLVLHQYPIRQGSETLGYIDLVSERAFRYHAGAPADEIPLPEDLRAQEQAARQELLETLANHDDRLLEELLEDIAPSEAEIVGDLRLELGADLVVPVFLGMADRDFGVRSLLSALAREAPDPAATATARGIPAHHSTEPVAQVLKTYGADRGGKLSLVRVWQGAIEDGATLNGVRLGSLAHLMGNKSEPVQRLAAGEIGVISRLEGIATGDSLAPTPLAEPLPRAELAPPVFAWAIAPENRSDEVKLTAALAKLVDEDPSLTWEQRNDTHEVVLWGQGEIHLQLALDRLRRKYNLPLSHHTPQIPYRETIRQTSQRIHGRYKHQSGGHGQFGDVYLDIGPLPRGGGFAFQQKIVGGVVPKQYVPGVETGVKESLDRGPLGFPVVDVAVTLVDGSYHTVDSSEQAFKQAAHAAMKTGLSSCGPVLLEPIYRLVISTPSEFTARVLQLVTGRRGQILGYLPKEGWTAWDEIQADLPQAEMQAAIVELRSIALGVGSFAWTFDRLQEVPDKLSDRVLASHNANHS